MPSWHSDVVTTLSQRHCWRCHNVKTRSKMKVVPMSFSDFATTSLSDVIKTLSQRCCNVATTFSIGFLGHFALARINRRKWSLKKEKNKQNLNPIAENFNLKKIVYIRGSPVLCQPFFPYKPHTQTFLTFRSKWAPEEAVCLNNNSPFRARYPTKFWLIWTPLHNAVLCI